VRELIKAHLLSDVVASLGRSAAVTDSHELDDRRRRDLAAAVRGSTHRHVMTTTTPGGSASADRHRRAGGLKVVAAAVTARAASGDDGSLVPHPESESNPVLRRVKLAASENVASLEV